MKRLKRLIKASPDIMVDEKSLYEFMNKYYKDLLSKFSNPIFKCTFEEQNYHRFGYRIFVKLDINELIRRISERVELEGDGDRRIRLDDVGDVIISLNDGDIAHMDIDPKFLVNKACDFYYNYDYPTNIRCTEGINVIKDCETSFDYDMNLRFWIPDKNSMIDFFKWSHCFDKIKYRFDEYRSIFDIKIEMVDLEADEEDYQNAINGTGWYS